MRKKYRIKVLSIFLSLLLVFGSTASAFAEFDIEPRANSGTVTVTIEDSIPNPEGSDWPEPKGIILDKYEVKFSANDTMMDCIENACNQNNIPIDFKNWGDYISEIAGLSEFDKGEGSGWMGTHNGWFVDKGFGDVDVWSDDPYKLKDGDDIHLYYTQNLGADLGDSKGEGKPDQYFLKSLAPDKGTLKPIFSSEVKDYEINLADSGRAVISLNIEAIHKKNHIRVTNGDNEYRSHEKITVRNGDMLTVKIGNLFGPNPEEESGTYTIKIKSNVADYEDLHKSVEKAKSIKDLALDYTEIQKALDAVKYDLPPSKQAEVDKMTADINNAIENVKYKPADYTSVDKAIEKAKAKESEKETYANYDKVEAAIKAVVRGKDIRDQSVVDKYAEDIELAVSRLIKKEELVGNNTVRLVTRSNDSLFSRYGSDWETVVMHEKSDVELYKIQTDKIGKVYYDEGDELEHPAYKHAPNFQKDYLRELVVSNLAPGKYVLETRNKEDGGKYVKHFEVKDSNKPEDNILYFKSIELNMPDKESSPNEQYSAVITDKNGKNVDTTWDGSTICAVIDAEPKEKSQTHIKLTVDTRGCRFTEASLTVYKGKDYKAKYNENQTSAEFIIDNDILGTVEKDTIEIQTGALNEVTYIVKYPKSLEKAQLRLGNNDIAYTEFKKLTEDDTLLGVKNIRTVEDYEKDYNAILFERKESAEGGNKSLDLYISGYLDGAKRLSKVKKSITHPSAEYMMEYVVDFADKSTVEQSRKKLQSEVLTDIRDEGLYQKIDSGSTYPMFTFRNMQIVGSGTSHDTWEPDKEFRIYGDSIRSIEKVGDIGREYHNVIADPQKKGASIVAIGYGEAFMNDVYYPANAPDKYGLVVFDVDGSGDAIHPNMTMDGKPLEKDGKNSLRKYDVIHYTETITDADGKVKDVKNHADYKFKPSCDDGEVVKVSYHQPIKSKNDFENEKFFDTGWKTAKIDKDGYSHVELSTGNNLIKMETKNHTRYFVIKAQAVKIKFDNISRAGKKIKVGDKIKPIIEGMDLPYPKLSSIYNPGFPATTYLRGVFDGKDIVGARSQYGINVRNWFTDHTLESVTTPNDDFGNCLITPQERETEYMSVSKAKDMKIENIHISVGSYGSGLDGHCDVISKGEGIPPSLDADKNPSQQFGIFDDIIIPVLHLEYNLDANKELKSEVTAENVKFIKGVSKGAAFEYVHGEGEISILVDGKEVDKESYDVNGNLVILKEEFINALELGEHRISLSTVVDGKVEGVVVVDKKDDVIPDKPEPPVVDPDPEQGGGEKPPVISPDTENKPGETPEDKPGENQSDKPADKPAAKPDQDKKPGSPQTGDENEMLLLGIALLASAGAFTGLARKKKTIK